MAYTHWAVVCMVKFPLVNSIHLFQHEKEISWLINPIFKKCHLGKLCVLFFCDWANGSVMIACDWKPNFSNNLPLSHILQVPLPVEDLNAEISRVLWGVQPLSYVIKPYFEVFILDCKFVKGKGYILFIFEFILLFWYQTWGIAEQNVFYYFKIEITIIRTFY